MKAVIFDLETTMVFSREQKRHLIEIGAVKVDIDTNYPYIISSFQEFVSSPSKISKSTKKFLKLSKDDINKSMPIKYALRRFVHWIGKDYFLCSWADDDRKIIIEQCLRNDISLNWLKNYNDIQEPISQHLSNTKQLSLSDAIKISELEIDGTLHSAYYDALNAGKLFIKHYKQINLQENNTLENLQTYKCKIADKCKFCGNPVYRGKSKRTKVCNECFQNKISNFKGEVIK